MLLSLGFSYYSQLSWTSKVFPGTNPVHGEGLETRLYRLTFSINLPTAVFHLSIVFTFFLMTLEKACHSEWNFGHPNANKVWVKPFLLSTNPPTLQRRKYDVSFWKHSHPEIRVSVQGDLHREVNHLPENTVGATPDAGRKHQHHRTANSGWSSR